MTEINMKEIVKLAVDGYKGCVEQYSVAQSQEALRNALVELNNGSTKLDYRAIRDGKCNGLFSLIETILAKTVADKLTEDEFFMALVDMHNTALGDENVFVIEDSTLFVVDEVARGTQGLRRQRLTGAQEVAVPTSMHMVRIYEELDRVLSGRVDFNHLIDKVAESFKQHILEEINTLWAGITAEEIGGVNYYPTAGTFDEDALLDLVSHVEAASGGVAATIVGTKKALRSLIPSIQGYNEKNNVDEMGYVGKWYGTDVVAIPQKYKSGTQTFLYEDDVLTILAGTEKPIKMVYEGDPIMLLGDPMQNADLTQEYLYGERFGTALVVASNNGGIGRYEFQ